jgi:hypothetical protein
MQRQTFVLFQHAITYQTTNRGERTASALETRLDGIESKIEQLLASVEEQSSSGNGATSTKDGPSTGSR